MDNFVNEQDFELLKQDDCTFQVLDRILKGPCDVIRSDHEKLILCHSEEPYPVWIWTPDGLTEAEKEAAWQLAESCRPMAEGYRGVLPGQGRGGRPAGRIPDADVCLRLPGARRPGKDGGRRNVQMHAGGSGRGSRSVRAVLSGYRGNGRDQGTLPGAGNGDTATVGPVFTVEAYRRKHYAQNLVYRVTKRLLEKGFRAMLYTDAGYAASNECYRKIGYILRGRLCTVAQTENEKRE